MVYDRPDGQHRGDVSTQSRAIGIAQSSRAQKRGTCVVNRRVGEGYRQFEKAYISKPKLKRKVPSIVDKRNARNAQELSVRLSSPMVRGQARESQAMSTLRGSRDFLKIVFALGSKPRNARQRGLNGGSGVLYRGHISERKGAAAPPQRPRLPRTNPHHSRGQAHRDKHGGAAIARRTHDDTHLPCHVERLGERRDRPHGHRR